MSRLAYIDTDGILFEHGYAVRSGGIPVAEDFDLAPGYWRWDGSAWLPFTPPPTQDELNRADARSKVASAVADAGIPLKVRDALQAIGKALLGS